MKSLKFLILLLIFAKIGFAQEIDKYKLIVNITIESINNQSSEKLNDYLSDDFTIAGQKGKTARLVLNQLLSQLGETVKSHQEVSQHKLDEGLELKYNIDYEKMGLKEATFIFNKNNLLKDISFFPMEVKTLSGNSEVNKSSKDIIEIPFTIESNLIVVDVQLNGKNRTFILDSGSPQVILNSKHIAREDTRQISVSSSKGVGGSISGMDIEKVEQLDFGGIQLNNQEVITLDLSHLEEELEMNFYGLIGYDLIKDYDIIFDYKKQILTLIEPDIFEKYKDENLVNNDLEIVPFKLEGHIPVVEAEIDNMILSYGIDCGAESNLIDDSLFQSFKKSTKRIKTSELVGTDNNIKEVKKGKIKKIKIGGKIFKKLPTVFSDISHLNEGYKLNLSGLIGYEVLSKQKTLISFKRKEMIFIE